MKVKYLILGAGVSGISSAYFLGNNEDYIILEKTDSPGGYCKTIKKDGFTWDYSGHFFHFRNDDIKKIIFENINTEDILSVTKKTAILYNDIFIDYPFQKNISSLSKEEFIDCLYDFYFRKNNLSENFLEWLYNSLGNSIVDKFVKPYNEKVYATDLKRLDVDAMGRFFPSVSLDDIISSIKIKKDDSYNSNFLYPKKGAITYIESLMKKINQKNIIYNTEVLHIDKNKKIIKTNKFDIEYEYLISTIPLNTLLNISNTIYDKSIYSYNKVLVFNLGFDKPSTVDYHWIYIPQKDICFYRVGFYDNILNENRCSLYVEIGLNSDINVNIGEYIERVLNDLKKINIISDHNLISYQEIVMSPAYVHLSKKSNEDSKKQIDILNNYNIFPIGRYAEWTYCSIEDNMLSAQNCVSKIKL